jgi:hypothetical protein
MFSGVFPDFSPRAKDYTLIQYWKEIPDADQQLPSFRPVGRRFHFSEQPGLRRASAG